MILLTIGFNVKSTAAATGFDFVLVGYWKFDEGAGILAFDSSDYGNTGELIPNVNGPAWVTGIFGTALQFDGSKDYVNVSDSFSLDITYRIRMEAWIRPDVNDALMNIVSKRGSQGNYSYALNMGVMRNPSLPEHGNPGTHPGRIGFMWTSDGTSATEQYLVSSSVIPTNSWTNVTVVYDGSDVRMYLNGNLSNSTAYSGNIHAGNADLFIGHSADGSSYLFDGTIDEVKISRTFPYYDVALKAHCYIERTDIGVPITMDGTPTGFTTPHTFTKSGTHTFTVPDVDAEGHLFYRWNTGLESTTIIVSAGGTYIAYYGDPLLVEDHDIAVASVTTSRNLAYQSYTTVNVYVQVRNEGTMDETFNVTVYYNSTAMGTQTVTNLPSNGNTTLTFVWEISTGVPYGNYTISAEASPVPEEVDLGDNNLTGGNVFVTLPGDVNCDGIVNMLDVSTVSAHWYPGPPIGPLGYGVNTDIDGDGAVDIIEISVVSSHWEQSW